MTDVQDPPRPALSGEVVTEITAAMEAFRAARINGSGELSLWQPRQLSADRANLREAHVIRARARDLVRNDPFAANAVRMNRDAVSGSGLKLALKIDWRTLGIKDIEAAAEWQDSVVRAWEAYAENVDNEIDARREQSFSSLFALIDQTDYVDGEAFAVLELKPGFGPYQTCINVIDVDRLSNPDGRMDDDYIRGGVERDPYGEPIAYYVREGHPNDVGLGLRQFRWKRVPRSTSWGRRIALHTFDKQRAEMTRGVSAFSTVIAQMKMLQVYEEKEVEKAIVQALFAAVIKTELDWSRAFDVLGKRAATTGAGGNAMVDMMLGSMSVAAEYAEKRELSLRGAQVPHLLPNESLEFLRSEHPNTNFDNFEKQFIRKFASGLGVEAHELGKNYADVNYSAARAALLAAWRTYRARRNRIIAEFGMPVFGAWLEEAIEIGTVPMPPGVAADFLAAKPYLVRGTFIAWGKPMIDPLKERQAQKLGIEMGIDTLESISAEEGENWRDTADQIAYEKAYLAKIGVTHPSATIMNADAMLAPGDNGDGEDPPPDGEKKKPDDQPAKED